MLRSAAPAESAVNRRGGPAGMSCVSSASSRLTVWVRVRTRSSRCSVSARRAGTASPKTPVLRRAARCAETPTDRASASSLLRRGRWTTSGRGEPAWRGHVDHVDTFGCQPGSQWSTEPRRPFHCPGGLRPAAAPPTGPRFLLLGRRLAGRGETVVQARRHSSRSALDVSWTAP